MLDRYIYRTWLCMVAKAMKTFRKCVREQWKKMILCIQGIPNGPKSHTHTHSGWITVEQQLKKMAWVRVNAYAAFELSRPESQWAYERARARVRARDRERARIYCMPKSDAKEAGVTENGLHSLICHLYFPKTIKISEKWWSLINDMQSNALGRSDAGMLADVNTANTQCVAYVCVCVLFWCHRSKTISSFNAACIVFAASIQIQ